jgi:hypothetical protein
MSEKHRSQSMPSGQAAGAPDGTNRPARLSDGQDAGGDAGSGGPYPRDGTTASDKGEFRGGQSGAAYHGSRQLGDKDVVKGGNENAGAKED